MTERSLLFLLSLGLLLGACDDSLVAEGRLDGPADLAFLEPGPFFEVPVAFAANQRNGRVSKLDLKRSNLLVEDAAAPWTASPDLSFGAERILGSIALVATDSTVDVWVVDEGGDELLRQPYIRGKDEAGKPQWNRPYIDGVVSVEAEDGTPLQDVVAPELEGLRAVAGRAATETFSLRWDGSAFVLEGSESGVHKNTVLPSSPYRSDGGEVEFTLNLSGGSLPVGAVLRFATESGVEALPTLGLVTDLLADSEGSRVFATVLNGASGGWLVVYDALNFVEIERVFLGAGSQPESLDWGRDDNVLWIADSAPQAEGTGRILRVDTASAGDLAAGLTAHSVPEPTIDVAEGRDPAAARLFAAAAFSDAVWLLDSSTYQVLDINPVTPETDPSRVQSLIAGLEASKGPIDTYDLDEDGTRIQGYGVFASTFGGQLRWFDANSGCQVFGSPAGAAVDADSDQVSSLFVDVGFESNPELVWDAASERFVATHSCGGVSRSEVWTVTFDEVLQSYEVEGSRSGLQEGRAFEGSRYMSDDGSISFLILPGLQPTTAGDRWLIPIDDGITPFPLGEMPGDPLIYTELYDDRSGSWFHVKERQIALIPHLANDVVLWIDLQAQGDGGIRTYR